MLPGDIAILIMAGGHSRRFGPRDKLLADLDGQSLGLHVARRFAGIDWAQKRAVARHPLADTYAALGYAVVEPAPANGLGDNLALGAQNVEAAAILILLADMPFVSETHVRAMLDAATSTAAVICTTTAGVRSPPALIGRDHLADLQNLTGDSGARALFARAGATLIEIVAPPGTTIDIDTPDDLKPWRPA